MPVAVAEQEPMAERPPLLLLSHAGADTLQAVELARQLEASPEASAAGLKVWINKCADGSHRLMPGAPWTYRERAQACGRTT